MSENAKMIQCPLCPKRFTTDKQFIGHLANHKKKGEVFDFDSVRSQALSPNDDKLRIFMTEYAKVLPKITKIEPRRNDKETIIAFIAKICSDRGIQIECPNCHTKFCPEGEKT